MTLKGGNASPTLSEEASIPFATIVYLELLSIKLTRVEVASRICSLIMQTLLPSDEIILKMNKNLGFMAPPFTLKALAQLSALMNDSFITDENDIITEIPKAMTSSILQHMSSHFHVIYNFIEALFGRRAKNDYKNAYAASEDVMFIQSKLIDLRVRGNDPLTRIMCPNMESFKQCNITDPFGTYNRVYKSNDVKILKLLPEIIETLSMVAYTTSGIAFMDHYAPTYESSEQATVDGYVVFEPYYATLLRMCDVIHHFCRFQDIINQLCEAVKDPNLPFSDQISLINDLNAPLINLKRIFIFFNFQTTGPTSFSSVPNSKAAAYLNSVKLIISIYHSYYYEPTGETAEREKYTKRYIKGLTLVPDHVKKVIHTFVKVSQNCNFNSLADDILSLMFQTNSDDTYSKAYLLTAFQLKCYQFFGIGTSRYFMHTTKYVSQTIEMEKFNEYLGMLHRAGNERSRKSTYHSYQRIWVTALSSFLQNAIKDKPAPYSISTMWSSIYDEQCYGTYMQAILLLGYELNAITSSLNNVFARLQRHISPLYCILSVKGIRKEDYFLVITCIITLLSAKGYTINDVKDPLRFDIEHNSSLCLLASYDLKLPSSIMIVLKNMIRASQCKTFRDVLYMLYSTEYRIPLSNDPMKIFHLPLVNKLLKMSITEGIEFINTNATVILTSRQMQHIKTGIEEKFKSKIHEQEDFSGQAAAHNTFIKNEFHYEGELDDTSIQHDDEDFITDDDEDDEEKFKESVNDSDDEKIKYEDDSDSSKFKGQEDDDDDLDEDEEEKLEDDDVIEEEKQEEKDENCSVYSEDDYVYQNSSDDEDQDSSNEENQNKDIKVEDNNNQKDKVQHAYDEEYVSHFKADFDRHLKEMEEVLEAKNDSERLPILRRMCERIMSQGLEAEWMSECQIETNNPVAMVKQIYEKTNPVQKEHLSQKQDVDNRGTPESSDKEESKKDPDDYRNGRKNAVNMGNKRCIPPEPPTSNKKMNCIEADNKVDLKSEDMNVHISAAIWTDRHFLNPMVLLVVIVNPTTNLRTYFMDDDLARDLLSRGKASIKSTFILNTNLATGQADVSPEEANIINEHTEGNRFQILNYNTEVPQAFKDLLIGFTEDQIVAALIAYRVILDSRKHEDEATAFYVERISMVATVGKIVSLHPMVPASYQDIDYCLNDRALHLTSLAQFINNEVLVQTPTSRVLQPLSTDNAHNFLLNYKESLLFQVTPPETIQPYRTLVQATKGMYPVVVHLQGRGINNIVIAYLNFYDERARFIPPAVNDTFILQNNFSSLIRDRRGNQILISRAPVIRMRRFTNFVRHNGVVRWPQYLDFFPNLQQHPYDFFMDTTHNYHAHVSNPLRTSRRAFLLPRPITSFLTRRHFRLESLVIQFAHYINYRARYGEITASPHIRTFSMTEGMYWIQNEVHTPLESVDYYLDFSSRFIHMCFQGPEQATYAMDQAPDLNYAEAALASDVSLDNVTGSNADSGSDTTFTPEG